ncbi:unnamed protein product [Fusarium equiseti]|uniref:Uncharacterized protein n=1 Tax=Fusarium equiseti TaxID=61235 RepID=A0A8J2NBQ3_FUSEQ|nr:unnamed protein product [Fusarium equiseti]
MRVANILLTGASSLGALAQVPNHLNERAACNRDNLFRCFIDQRYSSQASDFCGELGPFTATVATAIATVTTTVEATITADTLESTEVHTTVFTETVPSTTVVVTAGAGAAVKRQAAVNPPKCMTNGVTYPASRITSACSCIDIPVSTVSVTHVIGTETVTETNTIAITPRATITSWETVSTTTSSGISTVTVPPIQANRLFNSDFGMGDSTGWEMTPDSWKGVVYQATSPANNWLYAVYGAEGSLGALHHIEPIYLEAGKYNVGLWAPLALFPKQSLYWQNVVGYELVHLVQRTPVGSNSFSYSKRAVHKGRIAAGLEDNFNVPETAKGYYEFSLKFLEQPPDDPIKARSIGDLYLRRTS